MFLFIFRILCILYYTSKLIFLLVIEYILLSNEDKEARNKIVLKFTESIENIFDI